jgi:hypothetical protein
VGGATCFACCYKTAQRQPNRLVIGAAVRGVRAACCSLAYVGYTYSVCVLAVAVHAMPGLSLCIAWSSTFCHGMAGMDCYMDSPADV